MTQRKQVDKIVDYTTSLNQRDLESYLRDNEINQETLHQALIETIKKIRTTEDHFECIRQLLKYLIIDIYFPQSKCSTLNFTDKEGRTPLMFAAQRGYLILIEELLQRNIEVYKKDNNGKTALHYAIESQQDNWDIVATIGKKEDVQEADKYLMQAIGNEHVHTVEFLLKYKSYTTEALIESLEKNNLEIIKQVVKFANYKDLKQIQVDKYPQGSNIINEELNKRQQNGKEDEKNQEQQEAKQKKKNKEDIKQLQNRINQLQQQLQTQQQQNSQLKEKNQLLSQSIPRTHQSTQTEDTKDNNQPKVDLYTHLIKQKDNYQNEEIIFYDTLVNQLNHEIKMFGQSIEQYQRDTKLKHEKLIEQIQYVKKMFYSYSYQTIQQEYPQTYFNVFGSYKTQLNLPYSDIDLVLNIQDTQENISQILQSIKTVLTKNQALISKSLLVDSAAMPVLKLESSSEYDYKKVDITLFSTQHSGIACANLIIDVIKQFSEFKYLAFILKHFLNEVGLLNPFQGGLSSFGLMLMIVSFLQHKHQQSNENFQLGALLIEFLEFYGVEIDYYGKIIVVNSPQRFQVQNQFPSNCKKFDIKNILKRGTPQKLFITDPIFQGNVAKSTFKLKKIKYAFILGLSAIYNSKKCTENCYFRKESKACCLVQKMINAAKSNKILPDDVNQQVYQNMLPDQGLFHQPNQKIQKYKR